MAALPWIDGAARSPDTGSSMQSRAVPVRRPHAAPAHIPRTRPAHALRSPPRPPAWRTRDPRTPSDTPARNAGPTPRETPGAAARRARRWTAPARTPRRCRLPSWPRRWSRLAPRGSALGARHASTVPPFAPCRAVPARCRHRFMQYFTVGACGVNDRPQNAHARCPSRSGRSDSSLTPHLPAPCARWRRAGRPRRHAAFAASVAGMPARARRRGCPAPHADGLGAWPPDGARPARGAHRAPDRPAAR